MLNSIRKSWVCSACKDTFDIRTLHKRVLDRVCFSIFEYCVVACNCVRRKRWCIGGRERGGWLGRCLLRIYGWKMSQILIEEKAVVHLHVMCASSNVCVCMFVCVYQSVRISAEESGWTCCCCQGEFTLMASAGHHKKSLGDDPWPLTLDLDLWEQNPPLRGFRMKAMFTTGWRAGFLVKARFKCCVFFTSIQHYLRVCNISSSHHWPECCRLNLHWSHRLRRL